MWAENDDSDQPRQRRQRRQRRIEIHKRIKRISDEAASEAAARNSLLPTGEGEERTKSLEAGEQDAAARREQEREELQNELYEIRRADRARQISTPGRLSGEQDQAVLDPPEGSSPPHVSDSDQQASPTHAEKGVQSTEPEGVDNFGKGDKAYAADNPDTTPRGTRWLVQQDLEKLMAQGIDLYRSEATDAVYYLDDLGEEVWVVDQKGDCIIAQDQNLG